MAAALDRARPARALQPDRCPRRRLRARTRRRRATVIRHDDRRDESNLARCILRRLRGSVARPGVPGNTHLSLLLIDGEHEAAFERIDAAPAQAKLQGADVACFPAPGRMRTTSSNPAGRPRRRGPGLRLPGGQGARPGRGRSMPARSASVPGRGLILMPGVRARGASGGVGRLLEPGTSFGARVGGARSRGPGGARPDAPSPVFTDG